MATKVLIVEDNIHLAVLLERILAHEGFEVKAAANGREGYSAYLVNRPDVILTDIQMPQGNGLELMKHIRSHDPEARAIYMSSDWETFQPAIQEEERKFCARFIRKPFSEEELMRLLSECLNGPGKEFPERI